MIGYLVIAPLIGLQAKAFDNGAEGYREAFTVDGIGRIIAHTIGLAVGSVVIALVLGTLLAWAASRLPRRLGFLRSFRSCRWCFRQSPPLSGGHCSPRRGPAISMRRSAACRGGRT